MLDLTALSPDCTMMDVEQLCERARTHRTAAVCIWPEFVIQADAALSGSQVAIATVVNFPTGQERAFNVGTITDRAVIDGATEIDVVLPHRAFVAGDLRTAELLLSTVRRVASRGGAKMKVILETGELGDPGMISAASRFAIDHGADFLKTSTGTTPVSATVPAVEVMLSEISRSATDEVGIKPSGGITTLGAAAAYIELADRIMGPEWATPARMRLGASRLLDELLSAS